LTHLGADGRLGTVTGLSRFGEALEPDNLKKRMKLVQIHIKSDNTTGNVVTLLLFGCVEVA
jgi:hypothetical protein